MFSDYRQLNDDEKFEGREIKHMIYSSYGTEVLFVFKDNTFAVLRVDEYYDQIEIKRDDFNYTDFYSVALDSIGFMSLEEIAILRNKEKNERQKYIEDEELKTYKRLKEKYDSNKE